MSKTYMAKPHEVAAQWHVVDASGKVLGRLASRVATILQGKHRPTYTPHLDTGDFVIVVNAEKVKITGRKLDQRLYHRQSKHVGNLKSIPMREMLEKHPERLVHEAVRRMLPRSRLGAKMLRKLKIYAGRDHPHQAQNPKPLDL
ncbi:MAG: 50S ribosomal protein L13 [Candidatus Brocadiia bacterium]